MTAQIRSVVRTALVAALAAGLLAVVFGVRPADPSAGGRRAVIRVWHVWGGPQLESYRRGVELFERTHPDIACKLLYVPNDLSNCQKFYTAVIGDCAPEVVFVDGPQVAEWAERGLLTPLDDLLAEYARTRGMSPDDFREGFFPPCWKQCHYRGRTWAITYCADPNFCFFWNKDAFRSAIARGEIPAGQLDPDRPPATLQEMDRYTELISRIDGQGRLMRAGLIPWGVYGRANSIFTWGWAFGGEFYDEKTGRITADHPRVVEALKWMVGHARKYDIRRVAALQSTFGTAEQNPFVTGRQTMQALHLSGMSELEEYAPEMDIGIAPLPACPGGEPACSWVGGWALAIPKGTTDPAKVRAALEYILWTCTTPEGTAFDVRTKRNIPAWKDSPYFEEAMKYPRLAPFVEILRLCKHQRPVMPAQAYFMNELDRAVDRALREEMSPEEALRTAGRRTQERLDAIVGGRRGE